MPDFNYPIRLDTLRGRSPRAVDVADPIDYFDAWILAEAESTFALASWRDAPRAQKPSAHAGYVAALDAEEQAAALLERRLQLAD